MTTWALSVELFGHTTSPSRGEGSATPPYSATRRRPRAGRAAWRRPIRPHHVALSPGGQRGIALFGHTTSPSAREGSAASPYSATPRRPQPEGPRDTALKPPQRNTVTPQPRSPTHGIAIPVDPA